MNTKNISNSNPSFDNLDKIITQNSEEPNIFKRLITQTLATSSAFYKAKEDREKEKIYEKLLEIQILSKLMCGDDS